MWKFVLAFLNAARFARYEDAQDGLTRTGVQFDPDEDVLLADMLDEQEQIYIEEVEHGWDRAWEDHYFGEGP